MTVDEFPEALGGLPDPVVVVDGDGVVRGATARVEPVLGYAPEGVTGTDVESLLFDPDDGAAGDELRRYVVHPEPRSVSPGLELVARRADGSTVPVTVGFGSFDSDGETYLAVTIVDAETGREAGHRRTQTLEALHEATQDLLKTTEREVAAEAAVEYVEEVLGHPIAAIWLYDAERELLDPVCWTDAADRVVDEHPTFTADEPSISWRVFESGEAEYISDTHAEPDRYDSDSPIRSELVLPLGRYGMIHVGATEPDAFTEPDLAVARLWAATVTMVFVRIERERQLKAQQQAVARERDRLKDFASVVSHDLRNPLNVAAGNL